MTPERLQQIEELYHAACDASAGERAALLAKADSDLRREVESLLIERESGEYLNNPAIAHATQLLRETTLSGTCLGPYRIESKLGEGGMGQVYRAVDTRLGRSVAIKTTREQFSDRFSREARAISSLNHPNICTLHDVGPNYIVMELVEGETLAARLKRGPIPLETALVYCSQILSALTEAHGKGIVHRDLKPANIMVGKSGIKVLDFGLARSHEDESVTATHMIIGTPAYMAPEQREGKPADARTDIYSFGCVLYELLTGARFGPNRKRIRPRKLEQIVNRCLAENPQARWQSAAELQRELASLRIPGRWTRAAAAAACAVLVLSGAGYLYFGSKPKPAAKHTIVLGEFENKTPDPAFNETLRQGLAVQLQESPFLVLVSDENINRTLRLMLRPPETRLAPDTSREICERTGGSAFMEGSIENVGTRYILWLRAKTCSTGTTLAQDQAQVTAKEEVLNALGKVAAEVATRLGESLGTMHAPPAALEEATTASVDALRAYTAAKTAIYAHSAKAALPHLQRALSLDPQFAMAHADLGFMAQSLGQTERGASEVRLAYALRDRVSDREQRYIDMLYDRQVTGNLQKELLTLESWAQTYPLDPYPPGIISGWVAWGTGQYERGVQAAQQAARLNPQIPFPYESLATHNFHLGRYKEAAAALQLAAQKNIEIPEFLVSRFYLAFIAGDQAGMDREVARAAGQNAQDRMAHHQALVLARSGRIGQARTLWDQATASAIQAGAREPGARESAAIYEAAQAVCEAHLGNIANAKDHARAALKIAKGRDVVYAAAFALALAGETAEPHRLAEELEKRFPEDTPVQFEYLPTLHALSALTRHAPLEAVERLKRAIPYEFAMPGTSFYARFGGLYPVYLRGQAYLAAGRGQEAAAEFQKILARRGIVYADPIGALAHLQLGRAYVLSGDIPKARASYREFLTLWKDADPDLPVLKAARTESAKL